MLLGTVIVFFLILSVLVLIHEAGHFTAAKKLGIKVEEFGFGLPPRIFGIKRGETVYSLNWLPIGGFVKLYGEEGEEEAKEQDKERKKGEKSRAFYARPAWQRAIVLTAGVLMNFILAVVIISFLFTQGVMVPSKNVRIREILPNSPAAVAGLQKGDIIRQIIIDGNEKTIVNITASDQLINTTKAHLGEAITLVIEENGQSKNVIITPRKDYPAGEGPMGVSVTNYEERKYPFWQAPFYGTREALVLSVELAKGIGNTLWKLISFQPVSKDVAGPIGIAQMTGEAIGLGRSAVLELLGLLSLNLAIVNILPFPALDGGRLLFVVIEAVTGKKVKNNYERVAHQIGMAILIALIILVTVNDIYRLISK